MDCLGLEELAHPALGWLYLSSSLHTSPCSASWTGPFLETAELVDMEPLPACLACSAQPARDAG